MRLCRKLATLGVIGMLVMEQCVPTFAAGISYGYYAHKDGGSTASQVTTNLYGTMAGNTSAYLSLTIRGVYSVRGAAGNKTTPTNSTTGDKMKTSISTTKTITENVPGNYYYAVECSGMYKTTLTGSYISAGGSTIDV